MSEAPRDTAPDSNANSGNAENSEFGGAVPVRLGSAKENEQISDAPTAGQASGEAVDDSESEPIELSPAWRADAVIAEEVTEDAPAEMALSSQWPPAEVPEDAETAADIPPSPPANTANDNANSGADGDALPQIAGQTSPAPNSGANAADDGEPENEDKSLTEQPMTLMDHLGELRTRLMRCLIGAIVGFLLCYGMAEQLFHWLAMPLAAVMPQDTRLIYTSVPEGFFVYLKVAFVAGVFLASPYIFYQVWAFVAPGLYKEERRQILPLSMFSAVFFIMGASFCYFVVFPYAFTFFMSYSTGMVVAMPSINEYLGFSLKMLVAFGLIFEMPVFAFFLARMGIVTAAWLRKVRRYAILVVFVVAAVLTPPDVFSQTLMAVPMIVLYEISILVAAAVGRKEKPATEKTEATA